MTDNEGALKGVKYDVSLDRSPAHPGNRLRDHIGMEAAVLKRDDNDIHSRSKPPKYRLNGHDEVNLKNDNHDHDRRHWKEGSMLKPIGQVGSSQDKRVEHFEDGSRWGNRNPHKDETPRVNTCYNSAIPPPYVKSNLKPMNGKFEVNVGNISHEGDGTMPTCPSPQNKPDLKNPSIHEAQEFPIFKSKSTRRKHSKSRSSHHNDDSTEDTKDVARKFRSRRRDDKRRGLQILFDDEQHRDHEEERIIDKLLLHYSKKSSSPVPEKLRRKSKSRHAHQMDGLSVGESSRNDETKTERNAVPPRSVSLPHEEAEAVKVKKEFTRAASFQPDGSNVARHVHPKLPDYDDLAARFAALKGR